MKLKAIAFFWVGFLRKEGTVLFNDALNTFYLQLYDIRHVYGKRPDR